MLSLALTFFVTTAPPPPAAAQVATATATATTKTMTMTMTPVTDKDYAAKILAPRQGKVVVVNFWASYCLPCLEEIPALQALAKDYASKVDVVFISSDDPSRASFALAVLARRKIELSSFIIGNEDPEVFIHMIDKKWQGLIPYTLIYNTKGEVIQNLSGGHSKAAFQAAIDAALQAAKP